jgi:hypothetical protein
VFLLDALEVLVQRFHRAAHGRIGRERCEHSSKYTLNVTRELLSLGLDRKCS